MANFNIYKPTLLQLEGGYQNHVKDGGNYNSLSVLVGTNHGISAPVYEAWLGYPPSIIDMQNMSQTIALEIHKNWYWNRMQANNINNQALAELIVDHAINAGVYGASKLIQQTLNQKFNQNLVVDGVIGNLTLTAINSVNANNLFIEFAKARTVDYLSKNNDTFLNSWLNRIKIIADKYAINISNLLNDSKGGLIVAFSVLVLGYLAYETFKPQESYV